MPIWTALLAAATFLLPERVAVLEKIRAISELRRRSGPVVVPLEPATGEINPEQLIALGCRDRLQRFHDLGEIADPRIVDPVLDDRGPDGRGPAADALCLDLAVSHALGMGGRHRGLRHILAHYCLASAIRYADATVVVPIDFLRVPLTATVGWLLYSERLDADGARRGLDPVRQSPELEAGRSGSRART